MKACDCEDSWRAVWAARSCLKKQNRKETYVPAKNSHMQDSGDFIHNGTNLGGPRCLQRVVG